MIIYHPPAIRPFDSPPQLAYIVQRVFI